MESIPVVDPIVFSVLLVLWCWHWHSEFGNKLAHTSCSFFNSQGADCTWSILINHHSGHWKDTDVWNLRTFFDNLHSNIVLWVHLWRNSPVPGALLLERRHAPWLLHQMLETNPDKRCRMWTADRPKENQNHCSEEEFLNYGASQLWSLTSSPSSKSQPCHLHVNCSCSRSCQHQI